MSQRDKNKIIFPGECIDNKDPRMLGRIRVEPEIDNWQEIMSSIPSYCAVYDKTNKNKIIDIKSECKWTNDDPFMFLPLLPFFINTVPKEKEYVNLIFVNKDFRYQDQFYIQGQFSSPMATPLEKFEASKTFLAGGSRNKLTLQLKNDDGTKYNDDRSEGIFPEPGDNAILGRGSSDVILKNDEVILRAGKYQETLNPNSYPVKNTKRSFLQLSYTRQTKKDLPSYTLFNLIEQVKVVQKLIEWTIFNPENSSNPKESRVFRGVINLYNVKPDVRTNTVNFKVDSDVNDLISAPIYQLSFFGDTFESITLKINQFIQGVNDGKISIVTPPVDVDPGPNVVEFNSSDSFNVPGDIFPFVFRPSPLTYQYIKNFDGINNSTQYENITKINNSIKFNSSDPDTGYGIIYNNGKTTPIYDTKSYKQTPSEYIDLPTSYSVMGADKLYFLSHQSQIPGKIMINLSDTVYGFPENTPVENFTDNYNGATSSMVRGEELIDFLNLLSKFLISHVHPFPGLPPVPVATDGTQSAQILTELLNAPNKILNQYIRIN